MAKKEEVKPVPMGLREYLELLKKTGYKEVSIEGLLKLVYVDDSPFSEEAQKKDVPTPPLPKSYFPQNDEQQKSYPTPAWSKRQIVRSSGLVEDICEHGVGHPNPVSVKELEARGLRGFDVHNCCGCCRGH